MGGMGAGHKGETTMAIKTKYETKYEWVVEEFDKHDDIVDINGYDTFDEAAAHAAGAPMHRIVLVRNVGNDDEGLVDRQWAYLSDGLTGTLPDNFDDGNGAKVPKKFKRAYG
jgi:hypothetical protein